MNPRIGRFKTRGLLGGVVLLGLVLIGVGLAARSGNRTGPAELSIPLVRFGSPKPTYVKRFSVASIDDHRLAFAWVDRSSEGERLWVCTVVRNTDGTLQLETKPEIVDHFKIFDATVLANGGIYGLVY